MVAVNGLDFSVNPYTGGHGDSAGDGEGLDGAGSSTSIAGSGSWNAASSTAPSSASALHRRQIITSLGVGAVSPRVYSPPQQQQQQQARGNGRLRSSESRSPSPASPPLQPTRAQATRKPPLPVTQHAEARGRYNDPLPPSSNRLVHAITWANALNVGPRLSIRNLSDHFRSGVLLCVLLERVARPKPVFASLNYRPLARRVAIANLEMVRPRWT